MARNKRTLYLPKRILVLCEGESEEIYIKGLKKDIYQFNRFQSLDVEIYQPKDYSPKGIVNDGYSGAN